MPIVTIMPSGKTKEAESGTRILDILVEAGENIGHKCDGKASCGTCHIFVNEGRKTLSKMNDSMRSSVWDPNPVSPARLSSERKM